jgi:hypothetical protein
LRGGGVVGDKKLKEWLRAEKLMFEVVEKSPQQLFEGKTTVSAAKNTQHT